MEVTPPDDDFERNGRDEPIIVMPDGSRQTYSRASTFSNYLEDKLGIMEVKRRFRVQKRAGIWQVHDRRLMFENQVYLVHRRFDAYRIIADLQVPWGERRWNWSCSEQGFWTCTPRLVSDLDERF